MKEFQKSVNQYQNQKLVNLFQKKQKNLKNDLQVKNQTQKTMELKWVIFHNQNQIKIKKELE